MNARCRCDPGQVFRWILLLSVFENQDMCVVEQDIGNDKVGAGAVADGGDVVGSRRPEKVLDVDTIGRDVIRVPEEKMALILPVVPVMRSWCSVSTSNAVHGPFQQVLLAPAVSRQSNVPPFFHNDAENVGAFVQWLSIDGWISISALSWPASCRRRFRRGLQSSRRFRPDAPCEKS